MLITWAILVTAPMWLNKVGLYQYVAVEIVIWMIFALAHNLLLGQGGMPSRSVMAPISAWVPMLFGLLQHRLGTGLLLGLVGSIVAAALIGALVASFISHRRASTTRS